MNVKGEVKGRWREGEGRALYPVMGRCGDRVKGEQREGGGSGRGEVV